MLLILLFCNFISLIYYTSKYIAMDITEGTSVASIEIWIGLCMLIIAVVGLFIKILQMNVATKIKINENTIRINSVESETNIKIINLQKDLIELKVHVNMQSKEMKELISSSFNTLKQENKEEHKELFDKLETMLATLTDVAISFKHHSEISNKRYTANKRSIQ